MKQAIQTVLDYLLELVRKFYVFIILFAIFYYVARYYANQKEVTYSGNLSFMVNTAKGGGGSGLAQLAGQFGFSGLRLGGDVSTERILELMRSKKMLYKALASTVEMNGKTDMLFNHYIRAFNLHEDWAEDSELKGFTFPSKSPSSFNYKENKAATIIRNEIMRDALNARVSEGGIITAICNSVSDEFCKHFLDELYKVLRTFYVSKTIEQQKRSYQEIEGRVDSLHRQLLAAESALASWWDSNKIAYGAGTLSGTKLMKRERLQNEAEVLKIMYEEALKFRETANMNLLNTTPVIQLVDYPTLPLNKQEPNRLMVYLIAIVMAFVVSVVLIWTNKLVMDALKK